ncbi:uncharacterized protein PG986_003857 [Apiospora aurea]|uniref:Uncharacterized protein n=1 Tax=Apiospora aurea TaxID=335848 RepID=A0ABR1QL68_9PEZI
MRDIEYAIHYNFCADSTFSTVAAHLSPTGEEQSATQQRRSREKIYSRVTLHSIYHHQPQDYDPITGQAIANNHHRNHHYNNTNTDGGSETVFDYNNPCAAGGCLFSQGCGSGQCRLEQLGGRWVCCRCRRGGNSFRWCAHPMRRVPDTLCYHTVCLGCWADQGHGPGQGGA